MNGKDKNSAYSTEQGVYHAPWGKAFDNILTPFEEFIHQQTTSGLLMGTAVIALILTNSPLATDYTHFMHTLISLGAGSWTLKMSLQHLINDGLMALFFFVVGLELKREILVGELAKMIDREPDKFDSDRSGHPAAVTAVYWNV